ncbi:hypothetical protein NADFUDRAFT_81421 [Nadsonia fulvescens var. elongata DSM 6958]|uniref:Ubiquitin-like domain-containing protein n=1 Tax=Nadsonia fulvescens var. elongata DSM 6958 TaxID=857566 RepID=A0A1E3PSQ4_9ASCO|nr:hypothetical protein NADFUDRAFT_81421 [Nadsonia fulvescens var. elongata DSM 6958]
MVEWINRHADDSSRPLLPISETGSLASTSSSNDSLAWVRKGKGKSKANPLDIEAGEQRRASGDESDITPADIIVRFADNKITDFTIYCPDVKALTVAKLKREIRSLNNGAFRKSRLRLINSGKVLRNDTNFAKDVLRRRQGQKSTQLPKSEDSFQTEEGSIEKIYIHCSVGEDLSAEELAEENKLDNRPQPHSTLPELRGFDRLRNAGFTQEDIDNMRQQFNSVYDGITTTGSSVPAVGGVVSGPDADDDGVDMRVLEERWIETGAGANDPSDVLGSGYMDDLSGMLVGLFFGLLALFFLKEGALFNKRQQRAIVAGVAVNFSFSIIRLFQ